jgi:CRISPR-associated exonuclease Cas4
MNTVDFQFITPSHVLHYLFCPRFAYFLYVLHIDEHENRRRLVMKGRDIHALKMVQNKEYLRSKIGVKDKVIDLYLSSHKLHLVGRVDEALFLNDGTAAPLDYKFAFWENRIYKTLRIQQTLYALLIEEKYNIPVHKAYLVYVRSKNHIEELPITLETKKNALDIVHEIFSIVNDGSFPNSKVSKRKCEDCAFRNICVR